MKKKPDQEQAALDLQDAQLRRAQIREAMLAIDKAKDDVRRLQAELAQAKRRQQDAQGKFALLCSAEKRDFAGANGEGGKRDGRH